VPICFSRLSDGAAGARTSVGSESELLPVVGSSLMASTDTVLQRSTPVWPTVHVPVWTEPPVGADAETLTVIVKLVDCPTSRLPTLQVTTPAEAEHEAPLEETNVVFGSSVSVTTMLLAVAGPLFVT
jgi:hypothetical protein